MPKKLEEIKDALIREGMSQDKAWAIATSQYNKMKKRKKSKPKSIDDLKKLAGDK